MLAWLTDIAGFGALCDTIVSRNAGYLLKVCSKNYWYRAEAFLKRFADHCQVIFAILVKIN
jgi:hypothetical protein